MLIIILIAITIIAIIYLLFFENTLSALPKFISIGLLTIITGFLVYNLLENMEDKMDYVDIGIVDSAGSINTDSIDLPLNSSTPADNYSNKMIHIFKLNKKN